MSIVNRLHSTQQATIDAPRNPSRLGTGFALITGGSHGIGRAIALECAARGINVLIVALPEPNLEHTLSDLRKRYPDVRVDGLGLDLRGPRAAETIAAWLRENDYAIDILVNNVGFGRGGLFESLKLIDYRDMVQLNNAFPIALTYLLLPGIIARPRRHILNVSSLEATLPLPYKSVYTGTKGFIYSFSLALREELRDRDVKVSVLCPGPVLTNEDGLRRIKAQGRRSQVLLMMPELVARIAVEGMLRGKAVIVPGRANRVIVGLMRFIPTRLKMRILEYIFRKYRYETSAGQ